MDGWTDGRTERPSNRDVRTHIKSVGGGIEERDGEGRNEEWSGKEVWGKKEE